MADSNIASETSGGPADTLAEFRRNLTATSHPPGPIVTWLGETVVHREDIRRPLGIAHTYPGDAVTRLADFYKGSNLLIGSKRRIAGVRLRATDAEWSSGEGPEVAGPLLSLVLAMTGRKAALDDLSGEGLATLRSRA
ncbi:MAG: maleylpyruvate isomerase family mycothiol-dependent enzyme [Actinomycetes bacterium]